MALRRRVDRLMRLLDIKSLVRGNGVRTSFPEKTADRAWDLLDRDFSVAAANCRWLVDFTYVRTWTGFVYVSLIDCHSRAIVDWHAATTKTTSLVTTALRMGLWRRDRAGHGVDTGLMHHCDTGSHYMSIHITETLQLESIAASIGDAYDNALTEPTIGLFKNEAIRDGSLFRHGPLRTVGNVECVTTRLARLVQRQTSALRARRCATQRVRDDELRQPPTVIPADARTRTGAAKNQRRYTDLTSVSVARSPRPRSRFHEELYLWGTFNENITPSRTLTH